MQVEVVNSGIVAYLTPASTDSDALVFEMICCQAPHW